MGAEESKIVLDALDTSYRRALEFKHAEIQIEPNEQFIDALAQLWSKTPENIKSKIAFLEGPPRKRRKGSQRQQRQKPVHPKKSNPAVQVPEPAVIDEDMLYDKEFFRQAEAWGNDPLAFFQLQGLDLSERPLVDYKNFLMRPVNNDRMDQLRRRFLMIIYSRLKKEILRKERLDADDKKYLLEMISTSGLSDKDPSEKQLCEWIHLGGKIESTCWGIGSMNTRSSFDHLGNLFFVQGVSNRQFSRMNEAEVEAIRLEGKYYRQQCTNEKCLIDMARQVIDVLWDCVSRSVTLRLRDSGLPPAISHQGNRGTSRPSPASRQDSMSPTSSPTSPYVPRVPDNTGFNQNLRLNDMADQVPCSQTQAQNFGLEGVLAFDRNAEPQEPPTGITENSRQDDCQIWDLYTGLVEDPLCEPYQTWDFDTGLVENISHDSYQMWDLDTGIAENPSRDSYLTWDIYTGIAELPVHGRPETLQTTEHQSSANVLSGAESYQVALDPSGQTIRQHRLSSGEAQPQNAVLGSQHLYDYSIPIPQNSSPLQSRFTGGDPLIAATLRQNLPRGGNNRRSIATPVIFS